MKLIIERKTLTMPGRPLHCPLGIIKWKRKNLLQKIESYSKEIIRSTIKVQLSLMEPVGVALDEMMFGIGDRIRGRRL